jgi:hypothetical protein
MSRDWLTHPILSAEQYRKLAEQALIEARLSADPEVSATLEGIAEDYRRLAKAAEEQQAKDAS